MNLRRLDLQFRIKGGEVLTMHCASHMLQFHLVGWRLSALEQELEPLVVRVDEKLAGLLEGLFLAAGVHVPACNTHERLPFDVSYPAAVTVEALLGWYAQPTKSAEPD
jgi:hypothetical protein